MNFIRYIQKVTDASWNYAERSNMRFGSCQTSKRKKKKCLEFCNERERGATEFSSCFPVMRAFVKNHVRQLIGVLAERTRDRHPVPQLFLPLR
jgi:hypothetical protein